MAGRILEKSIQEVREKARIDDVVGQYVTLRSAGGGSYKGLCPFHDEKSPSFNVNPSRGFYHCLAGETRVLTWEGPREIRELAGGVHRILNRHGDWVDAPFKSYGVQRLYRITLTRNRQRKELYATDGHRWFVRPSNSRGSDKERLTTELRQGDRLVPKYPRSRMKGFSRRGWVVQSVEETDRIEEVFCAEVEDGHAFTLEDNILTGNCFGCQAGGDVISFVMRIDGLGFGETVERLAEKFGVRLEREEGGAAPERRGPARGKLVEAHKVAAEFFAEQLLTPAALPARRFLAERSFDQEVAQRFGIGFAPTDGKQLHQHLRGRGFTDEELVTGGLVRQSGWSVFQGRVVWPIRESSGDVIGFGARKLFDDDRIAGKYINTSETPIYKKNQVLYGIDLAREGMRKTGQAVVVEGYTDVMACHLSGITTAVATCGTAFTSDHGKVVRRFMADFNHSAGEVVFTFDGDSAGQAAAMKVFAGDQEFLSQTYVAVAPDGLDPCDLRLQQGEEAVRELIAGRQPLYRFVLRNVVATHDLDRADGRIDALREGARLVSSVRDRSKVDAFARELAQLVGADPADALREVRRVQARRPGAAETSTVAARPAASGSPEAPAVPRAVMPGPRDPRLMLERETLKVLVQHPIAVGRLTAELAVDDFTHPAYRAVWQLIAAAGGPAAGAGDPSWAGRLAGAAGSPELAAMVSALAVEPLPTRRDPDAAYVAEYVVRLREAALQRRIADVHSRLQRADPAGDPDGYRALFAELDTLERRRRALRSALESSS